MKSKELEFLELPEQYSGLDPVSYQYFDNLLNQRTIIFNQAVDESVVETLIVPLLNFEKDNSSEPITVFISSCGGSVVDGRVVVDILDNYSKPLNIICLGTVYSMAWFFMCGGAKNPNVHKACYVGTTGLWHCGSSAISGESMSVEEITAFNRRVDDEMKEYILENTLISPELYEEKKRSQFFFTADELFKYGLVDEIIGRVKVHSKCKLCLMRKSCEDWIDYAYEGGEEEIECTNFEPNERP